MIQFEYNREAMKYNVLAPFPLTNVIVASISEDNRLTLHKELRIDLVRQILMHWDEYEHQMTRQEEQ